MARTKQEITRSHRINFRLTAEERIKLMQDASAEKMKVSTFIRKKLKL